MSGLLLTSPWILAGLLTLPVLWWLLRLTPPAPRVVNFPPTRILHQLGKKQETASKSPLWLTLMRLAMAAMIILALAGPILAPTIAIAPGSSTLLLIVDNGWSSADWENRIATAQNALDDAARDDRLVIIAPTAEPDLAAGPMPASEAGEILRSLEPRPYSRVSEALIEHIDLLAEQTAEGFDIVWFSDGLAHDRKRHQAFVEDLRERDSDGALIVYVPAEAALPLVLTKAQNGAGAMQVTVRRPGENASATGTLNAFDNRGRLIDTTTFAFEPGTEETAARFERPIELRNTFRRLELADRDTAGGVYLLDSRNERPTVGLIEGTAGDADQPLLSATHYIANALSPYSELRRNDTRNVDNSVERFVNQGVSMIAMSDIGTLSDSASDRLRDWVTEGGILLRFAGPRLAASEDERLLPVTLRRGGRTLGGTLSWAKPRQIDAFPDNSPFAGIEVEQGTTVSRQVLASPSLNLPERTWAQLNDGTPLVTARTLGDGWIILFHVAIDKRWSDLPLTGTFAEMVKRLTELASANRRVDSSNEATNVEADESVERTETATLEAPYQTLDATGRLIAPPAGAQPLPNTQDPLVSADHPPGFYGPAAALRAFNLGRLEFHPVIMAIDEQEMRAYPQRDPVSLAPWLLLAAIIILFLDALAVLWLTGRIGRRTALPAALAMALLIPAVPQGVHAQTADQDDFFLTAANSTRLAYVRTGDTRLDDISRNGLQGLSSIIAARTALEPGSPIGVDIARDELAFFPLLYWNVADNSEPLDTQTLARVDTYLKQGGSILFDTRDAAIGTFGNSAQTFSPTTLSLRTILSGLNIPALEPVPEDHVLTKAFYLLLDFPGRTGNGTLWVEAAQTTTTGDRPAQAGDGVSSIMITGNDMAGAWAIDETGRPMLPMGASGPGGREMAFRAGVNIVMYTLTGNYKADQVHIPALLERLGQ